MADRLKGVFSPWLRRQRFAVVQQFIKTGEVVDYGCGIGLLANFIPPERYIGLDVDDLSPKSQAKVPRSPLFPSIGVRTG
jgi:hypothetical protein